MERGEGEREPRLRAFRQTSGQIAHGGGRRAIRRTGASGQLSAGMTRQLLRRRAVVVGLFLDVTTHRDISTLILHLQNIAAAAGVGMAIDARFRPSAICRDLQTHQSVRDHNTTLFTRSDRPSKYKWWSAHCPARHSLTCWRSTSQSQLIVVPAPDSQHICCAAALPQSRHDSPKAKLA